MRSSKKGSERSEEKRERSCVDWWTDASFAAFRRLLFPGGVVRGVRRRVRSSVWTGRSMPALRHFKAFFFWRSSVRSEEKREGEVWILLVDTLNWGEVALLVFEYQVQEKQVDLFDKHFGPLQLLQQSTSSTPHAPQEAQKSEDEQPLQQAIAEEDAEITAEFSETTAEGSTEGATGSKSPCSKQLCRKLTGFLATFLAFSLTSFFGSFLASIIAVFLGPLLGYSRCMEGMEATGQG